MHLSLPQRPSTVGVVVAVTFCSNLYFYLPIMTLLLQGRGLSLLEINTLQAILIGAQFAAEVPTGVLADRWGRKRSWLVALAIQFLGELLFLFAHDFWLFVLIQVIAGCGFAFASGCVEALVYDALPPEGREGAMKRALGRIGAAARLGNLLAFSLGGLIAADLQPASYDLAVALTVAAVGASCLVALLAREVRQRPGDGAPPSSLLLLRAGAGQFWHNAALRRLVLLGVLSDPFGFFIIVLYQPYFVRAGVPGGWFGPALALGSLLAVVSERYAYLLEERIGMRWGLLGGTALPGLLYLVMAPVTHPVAAVVLFCVQYGTMYAVRPILRAYINGHIASEQRATALSLIQLVGTIYLALIGLLLGYVADRSIPGLFLLMGTIVLASALLLRQR